MSIFTAKQSVELATSIARRAGIEVVQYDSWGNSMPRVNGRKIVIGSPGIYTHEVYMEELHRCIGQVCPENDFFSALEAEGREDTLKEVIRSLHTDKYLLGEYEGRDRQLASGYSRRLPKLQESLEQIAMEDPITGALLCLGNELRNEWQGFNTLYVPEDLKPVVEKLRPLGPRWMSLETEDDLKDLMKELKEIEEDEQMADDNQGDGQGEPGESGEESKDGSPGSEGDAEGDLEDGDGDPSDETGDGSSSGGESPEGSGESPGEPGEAEGSDPETENPSAESSGVGGDPASGSARPTGYAKNDTKDLLKDLGIIPDGLPPEVEEPYVPGNPVIYQDNRADSYVRLYDKKEVEELLKDFRLTQKVKKYLLTLTQVGWNSGLKSGTLNTSKIHRLYSTQLGSQPRVYKKREKPKLKTDIAISLLIDDSGSMIRSGKVFMAAACAVAMSEVLQGIKVPHDILMFTTDDNNIVHSIVKDFSESFVSRDRLLDRLCRDNKRLQENADGEAVLWAAERLMSFKSQERLLIVLSDGYPSFNGAKGSCPQYLRDVVKVIEEAKGIDVLGIGILDKSVGNYYKRHEVLKNLSELEPLFMRLLSSKIVV